MEKGIAIKVLFGPPERFIWGGGVGRGVGSDCVGHV